MNLLKSISLIVAMAIVNCSTTTTEKVDIHLEQPHILLIMTDQHRGDALGYMGNSAIKTPNIDRLAADGVYFTNGYSSTPSCTPARAGLLTGQSPWNHGMLGYGKKAREYEFQMPRMLREGGYFTFGIGKMHWNPQRALHGFHGTLLDESARVEQEGFISDYRKWFMLNAPGKDPDETGIGFNEHRASSYKLAEELHPTNWTGQTAVEIINNYKQDSPLFLKVSFARPHSPYDPPQRYLDMYDEVDIPGPAIGDWAAKIANYPMIPNAASAAFGDFGRDHAINSIRHYYALVTAIDDQVGHIVQALKENGMYDNTLIAFTSDHGDMLGDHHHWRKTYPYQGSVHIPFLLRWPVGIDAAIERGSALDHPVELRDFLPTFLDAAGISIPNKMDGTSLLNLVKAPDSEWRPYIDLEHARAYIDENYWSALTDGRMKYIWYFKTGQEQFFDLENDPRELTDLSENEEYQEGLKLWRHRMIDHLAERGSGFAKDGELVIREEVMLYSPNYPEIEELTPEEKLENWREDVSWLYSRYRAN